MIVKVNILIEVLRKYRYKSNARPIDHKKIETSDDEKELYGKDVAGYSIFIATVLTLLAIALIAQA